MRKILGNETPKFFLALTQKEFWVFRHTLLNAYRKGGRRSNRTEDARTTSPPNGRTGRIPETHKIFKVMETIQEQNQLIVYGYIDEETRCIVYQKYYNGNEDFLDAITKARDVKKKLTKNYQKLEIICHLVTTMKIE